MHSRFEPRPLADDEYCLYVLNGLKRFLRKSDIGLGWLPPRHWASNEPDRREVLAAIDHAIDAVRGAREEDR